MINLSKEQLKYIKKNDSGFIVIDNKRYYFKTVHHLQRFNEIIGKKIANLLNINCASYELHSKGSDYFYLSDDLNNYGTFVLGKDIYESYKPEDMSYERHNYSLYEMWNSIQYRYGHNGFLVIDLVKTYLMDIFLINVDRHYLNWGILESNDDYKLYILDNTNILLTNIIDLSSFLVQDKYYNNLNRPNIFKKNKYGYSIGVNMVDLEYFLRTSSEEFIELFSQYFELLNPDYFSHVLDEVEKEYNARIPEKNKMLEKYCLNYEAIREVKMKVGIHEVHK